VLLGDHIGMAVLALGAGDDIFFREAPGDLLQAVADPEDGNTQIKERWVGILRIDQTQHGCIKGTWAFE
jgi:hypothetical protein